MWCARRFCWAKFGLCLPSRQYNVTVVGSGSEMGQATCLLLRSEPYIKRLNVHDNLPHISGVMMDLVHIPTDSALKVYKGDKNLIKSLNNADIVLVMGDVTQGNKYVRENERLLENIAFIKNFATKVAKVQPMPFIGIATEPINVCVPMAAEIIKSQGRFDPKKLFGVTGTDSLRAAALYSTLHNVEPHMCSVPVICGHSDQTIVPLLSQARPACVMSHAQIKQFIKNVRQGRKILTEAKNGYPPSLSVAHSVMLFTRGIVGAISGRTTPVIDALVENNDFGTSYFAGRMVVTSEGAGDMERFSNLSEYECELLEYSISQLRKEVMSGKRILELE